ncbi:MAG: DEAD/DEAH box helicase [Candidatus Nanohaloarchaeota archaeon QJJ-9]|nr:DEAD/DEAH box helicase [Candidatus Nanohaloarchaeota archaeon QJJ-9]
MPEYIEHPKIEEETLESRAYQEVIAAEARDENSLCVLPTGLGKTAVAIMTAAHRLEELPSTKILMLSPTKPLTEQHKENFQEKLNTETDIFQVMTGETRPEKREELWKEIGCFFATPQVVENDLISGRLDLTDFSFIVFDECHRATGDYPYSFIAEKYIKQAENPRILGLTASPGGDKEKIDEVAENLYIDNFEVRTEDDPDVKPYVEKKNINWKNIPLNRNFKRCKKHLEAAKKTRVKKLESKGYLDGSSNKKDLLKLQGKLRKQAANKDDPEIYQAISRTAAAIKVDHALELLETQGIKPLYDFLEKMEKDENSKAAKRLLNDKDFQNARSVCEWMYNNEKLHPKLKELKKLFKNKLTKKDTAIVFTQYRNTVDRIKQQIEELPHINPLKFKGQKGEFTQKKQLEILEKFKEDKNNVLVSTSVGEEGLDIPAVDYVIFYEPIPSEIRTIQRKGRTGRQEEGNVYVLIAENTRDEAYYWSSKNKEKKMKSILKDLKDKDLQVSNDQKTLDSFSEEDESGLIIYVDDRENRIAKELSKKEVKVRKKRLNIADFIVSDRAAVERKTTKDFSDSIVDQRLFTQVQELKEEFEKPIIIIEGESLYGHRDIHPNAIRGALSSIVLDYQIPIVWTKDEEETVENLIALAKREQEEQDRGISIRGEQRPTTEKELQKYVVSGLPNISDKLAERLLEKFGSVKEVFNSSETELKKVEGIGEGKAERIREIIDKEYQGG